MNLFDYHSDPRKLNGYLTSPRGAAHYLVNHHKIHKDELGPLIDKGDYDGYAAKVKNNPDLKSSRKHLLTHAGVAHYLELYHKGKITDDEILKEIAKYPDTAYKYARLIGGRFELGEKAIATDPNLALDYAMIELDGPFPLGERAIATNPDFALTYATNVLNKKPFKLGEKAMATNHRAAMRYAVDCLKGPFTLGEKAIATDPISSYRYAVDVLGGPFVLGEDAIARNGRTAIQYAINILKHRWEKGEPAMKNDEHMPEALKNVYKRISGVDI